MGKTGIPPFNLFLHPDLALSVAAPFNAAVNQQFLVSIGGLMAHKVRFMDYKQNQTCVKRQYFHLFPQLLFVFLGEVVLYPTNFLTDTDIKKYEKEIDLKIAFRFNWARNFDNLKF